MSTEPVSYPDEVPKDVVQYWANLWAQNSTRWQLNQLNPALQKFGEKFMGENSTCDTTILFPLCGKTIDMTILAQKYKVIGIEGVHQALIEYANENKMELNESEKSELPTLKKFTTEMIINDDKKSIIDLYLGDFFSIDATTSITTLPQYDRVFDRGSLVAILPKLRASYMKIINSLLKPGGKWMIVSMGYDQMKMQGPPNSIDIEDVEILIQQLMNDVPGTKYTIETWESIDAATIGTSRFLTSNGGSLETFRDNVFVLTKQQ